MLKKLRKTLNEEFKKRYEKMEGRYLGLENRIYTTIENRLAALEQKFEELSDLLKEELQQRKEQNNDKLEEMDYVEEPLNGKLSEKVGQAKDSIQKKIKGAQKNVAEQVEKVGKKVKKAKKTVEGKLKKDKKKSKKASSKNPKAIQKDDLTQLKGLGAKIAEQLAAQQVVNFEQLAALSDKDLGELDKKIKGFAARYKRYNWKEEASKLA